MRQAKLDLVLCAFDSEGQTADTPASFINRHYMLWYLPVFIDNNAF